MTENLESIWCETKLQNLEYAYSISFTNIKVSILSPIKNPNYAT